MPDNSENNPSKDELSHRLDALKDKLGESQPQTAERQHKPSSSDRAGIAQALRLSSEFIAGVIVGGAIGYAVDTFFNTSPWGLIVFLLLGFCAAILNILRAAGMVAESGLRVHKGPSSSEAEMPTSERNRDGAGKY